MTNCPHCSNQVLRHIRHNHMYWFCRNCWQDMPLMQLGLGPRLNSIEQHPAPRGLMQLLPTR